MRTLLGTLLLMTLTNPATAMSIEDSNGCTKTQDDPCVRSGTCQIQGATWAQAVTIDRSDIFDTQGWPGLCDMVHVALVQGNCEPPAVRIDVVAFLSETSVAVIPEILGPLSCAGEPEPEPMPMLRFVGTIVLTAGLGTISWSAARRAAA